MQWLQLPARQPGTSSPPGSQGTSSPTVASLPPSTSAGTSSGNGGGGTTTTTLPNGDPTRLLDEWADCMRSHGDPNQADPTVDAYGVININIPGDRRGSGAPVWGGPFRRPIRATTYIPTAQAAYAKLCAQKTGAHVPGAGGPPPPGTIRLDGAGPLPNGGAGANG